MLPFWLLSFGIGSIAQTIGNTYLRVAFQTAAHGLYNGISSELQGGKFIHGFASGSISSISGSLTGGLKMGVVGKVAIGGVSGGVVSAVVGGDFYRGFLQGAIITAFNHALHSNGESAATSTTETESVENESGPGDPPQIGDICFDECGQAQVYDGKGWVPWRFTVTGTGQITPTDSPIEWLLGAWKTPFQAADDVAVLGFAKIAGGNSKNIVKISDKLLKNSGIDAHKLKQDFLGVKAQISRYDLYKNTNTGEILIFLKGGKGNPIQTGEFIK